MHADATEFYDGDRGGLTVLYLTAAVLQFLYIPSKHNISAASHGKMADRGSISMVGGYEVEEEDHYYQHTYIPQYIRQRVEIELQLDCKFTKTFCATLRDIKEFHNHGAKPNPLTSRHNQSNSPRPSPTW